VLRTLAEECGVAQETVEKAWHDAAYEQRLRHNLAAAIRSGATGTPTFFIGEQRLTGAVPVAALMAAAQAALAAGEPAA
jgi:NhaA family Na+:H+ antiporter